jgi:hypothetical protein
MISTVMPPKFEARIRQAAERRSQLMGSEPISGMTKGVQEEYAKTAACDLHLDAKGVVDPAIVKAICAVADSLPESEVRDAVALAWAAYRENP